MASANSWSACPSSALVIETGLPKISPLAMPRRCGGGLPVPNFGLTGDKACQKSVITLAAVDLLGLPTQRVGDSDSTLTTLCLADVNRRDALNHGHA